MGALQLYSTTDLPHIIKTWRKFNIYHLSTWGRGEEIGGGWGCGGGLHYLCLLLAVTEKIGKAFNVMQYLSNHPIEIRPSQSLLAHSD